MQHRATSVRKFIKDKTSPIVRRPIPDYAIDNRTYNPRYVNFGFKEALETLMFEDKELVRTLSKLVDSVEMAASMHIKSCEQAAVLLCHKAYGENLFLHTHRRSDIHKLTLSTILRLTDTDTPPTFRYYEPAPETDQLLQAGYNDPRKLVELVQNKQLEEYELKRQAKTQLLFDAGHMPHDLTYTNDLYLVMVYDAVELQEWSLKHFREHNHNKGQTYHNQGPYFL